jgi:hypothetical protein
MKSIFQKNPIFILVLFISIVTFSQDVEIIVGSGKFILDEDLNLIVCNKDISDTDIATAESLIINLNGVVFDFISIPNELEYGEQYLVNFNSQTYLLYFSELALININTTETIVDEPKVLANFILSDFSDTPIVSSFCGIEYRGGASQSYPKKSYDIELWDDQTGDETNKISLLDMRDDDDWLLLAMYNEPLRLRNSINHKLWMDIHTPYYLDQEEDAMSGVKTEYVEIAVNNEYKGLFLLSEQVDKKQLKLKKYNGSIRGELYKGVSWGASTFSNLPMYDNEEVLWSGFQYKYPKPDDVIDWSNTYNFVDFVINSTDNNFESNFENKFSLDNAIDYFIFLNLLRATDNRGKNIYLAKYKVDEPYFYVPWDLDGTYGIIWNGNQENVFNDILSNGMYDRLLNSNVDLFNQNASNRWFELRNSNLISTASFTAKIDLVFNFLSSNGNYERETLKWGESSIDFSNLDYTYEWIANRLDFLDVYFGSTILGVDEHLSESEILITPNPTVTRFKLENIKKSFSYCIYNVNGLLIDTGFSKNNDFIDVKKLSKGVYFLRIISDKNKYNYFKIVKN